MIKLTMPDGAIREAEAGITALELVKSISNSLAKKVLAVSIDDKVMDLTTVLDKDAAVQFLTFEDEGGRHALRHTASHILAQAVKRLYKDENVQLAIGPAIENGFYYDIDMEKRLTDEDLKDGKIDLIGLMVGTFSVLPPPTNRDLAALSALAASSSPCTSAVSSFARISFAWFNWLPSHLSISSICSMGRKVSIRRHFSTSASLTFLQY